MTDDIVKAHMKTLDDMGLTQEQMNSVLTGAKSAKAITPMSKSKAVQALEEEIKNLKAPHKTYVPKAVDKIIEPISDRMKKVNPRLFMKVQDQLRKSFELSHQMSVAVDPFLRRVEHLRWMDKNGWKAMHKAMFEGGEDVDFESLILKHMGDKGVADYKLYRAAMDEMYNLAKKGNPDLQYTPNYFPRWITDVEPLKKYLKHEDKSKIRKILEQEADKLKRKLTEYEENTVYNNFLMGKYDTDKIITTPGGVQKRRIHKLPDEVREKVYAKPPAAAHSYIKQMSTDIYRKEMFGSKIVGETGDNITDSIGAIAHKYAKDADDIEEVKTLLNLLYTQGPRAPKKWVQAFKDIGYSSMLGNPLSALTQVGDVFIAAGKIGPMETMSGLAKALTGRGLSPKEFGLMDNVIEELVSTGPTKKLLEGSLRASGFKWVDSMGKATVMNASLNKIFRQAKTATGMKNLRKRWGEAFGKDWPDVEEALRKGEINPNVKSMVFAELADIQPITLFEMPQWYLEHPNGRVLYMLKTFSLKFFNLLRRDVADKFASGDRKGAIINGTYLMAGLMAGGMTADGLKDFALRRESDVTEKMIDSAMAGTPFMSRYNAEKLASSGQPVTALMESYLPPVGWADAHARALGEFISTGSMRRETKANAIKHWPLIGRIWHNYAWGGLEEHRSKK